MSVEHGGGQPLNILKVEGRRIELDEHALARLLLDERVKDTPVVVLTVVGAFRKGKSFLMCFLLQFLRSIGRAEWLGDRDAPLEGFEWRGGSDRQTTGIMLWSEVFLVRNSVGEELAVLLMDTQGTFDCQSSRAVHSSIFSLSAMISSVLVYNVSQNIQEDDLEHLKDFVSYGTQLVQRHSSTSAERLLFLVRDWQSPYEKPYGLEGGKRLLESRLEVAPRQDEELKKLREEIKDCFKRIQCFLMPHPGLQVTEQSFDGRLSDIDDKFIAYLLELVPLLLEPDNLAPKEINGRKITCQELMSYIKVYVNAHKRGLLQDPSSMVEATYMASCRAAMEKALDFYTTSMMTVWQWTPGDVDRETMRGHHNKFLEVALEKFEAAPKMGGQEYSQAYSEKLKEKIEATFDVYCLYLREKKKVVFNTAFFKSVAFKVVHGIMTTGLAAGAIALAVVELPAVAIALGAAGAASLSGHFIQVLVEKHLDKRKRKSRQKKSSMAAETAEWFGASTINDDDEAQLRKATDDGSGQVSTEQPVSEGTSHGPPCTVAEELTMRRPSIASTSVGSASSSRMHAIERFDCDDRTPLLSDLDDCASVLSMEFPESENAELGPPDANSDSDEEATSKAVISAAFDRALKHYGDTMQSVCGDAVFRLSEAELKMYHNFLRQSAEDIFARACYSAGKRVMREHLDRLADETEEQFKNFFNQNREKDALSR